MTLRPRAPVSVRGVQREHYTAYRCRGVILFREVNENLRVLLRIALKLSKKTLRIGVPMLINPLPI